MRAWQSQRCQRGLLDLLGFALGCPLSSRGRAQRGPLGADRCLERRAFHPFIARFFCTTQARSRGGSQSLGRIAALSVESGDPTSLSPSPAAVARP